MTRIEKYIPDALTAVDEIIARNNSGKVPSSYNGYISAMGASIIQSGLLPTLALYENKEAKTVQVKATLSKIILKILAPQETETSLLHYVLRESKQTDERVLQQKIIDIAVAVKLAIRTFELDKGGDHE